MRLGLRGPQAEFGKRPVKGQERSDGRAVRTALLHVTLPPFLPPLPLLSG